MTAALAAQPTGLKLPSSFPDGAFEAVKDRILSKVPSASPAWEAGSRAGEGRVRHSSLRNSAQFTDDQTRFELGPV